MYVPKGAIKGAFEGGKGGCWGLGGINIVPFWTLLLFHSVTLFHTHGGPAHFLTNPISHSASPDFPLQLLIKLFRAATRGRVFKELHPPPHVVRGVLSRHRPPEWSPKNKAAQTIARLDEFNSFRTLYRCPGSSGQNNRCFDSPRNTHSLGCS